jgi:hypothetical protein
MTYAAEPYAVFVEDLLANLTGGVSRVRLRFVDEERPFELGAGEHPVAASVRVHGLTDGTFTQFVRGTDFDVVDTTIVWRESEPGVPEAGARWPDDGSDFWVGFEREPGHHQPPVLTDRNPGSITRTLAESFAMEFAVLAHQLEMVYEAAHLDTAEGRDLDHVVEMVGVTRRGQLYARGEVTFRRSTPSPADITIAAGTLVSTAEPPLVTVETVEAVTLRRGTVSVSAPVRAQVDGPAGVAPARSLTVVHRPILGVEEAINSQALLFGGGAEPDAELRSRARRALEGSGRSTVGAIRGILASLEGIREQDVLVEEDHLAFPGVVKVVIAADLDDETARTASRLLEEHRPAGIRIVHDLPAPTLVAPVVGDTEPGGGGDAPAPGGEVVDGVWFPIQIRAVVTPASTELTDPEREILATEVATAIRDHIDSISVGHPIVYNRLVAQVMAVSEVLDVVLDLSPVAAGPDPAGRVNLRPPTSSRARLDDTELEVVIGGSLVALDVSVEIIRLGSAATADPASAVQAAEADIQARLVEAVLSPPPAITPEVLLGLLPATADYEVAELHYTAELLEEGLLVERTDVGLSMAGAKQPWIRQVNAVEKVSTS